MPSMLRRVHFIGTKIIHSRFLSSAQELASKADVDVKTLMKDIDNETKLKLYALHKQASKGDVQGSRPSAADFIARAKFDAWNDLRGTSQEDAQLKYTEIVNSLSHAETESEQADAEIEGLTPVKGIEISRQDKAFVITLNRPTKFNALTMEMYEGLIEALSYSNKCSKTSITVVKANGPYFCSGNDLASFAKAAVVTEKAEEAKTLLQTYVQSLIDHEKPLVGLVQGPAVGISATVLGLFDYVLASDKSSFYAPFSSMGLTPEGCSTFTFPELMGHVKAMEFLMFNRKFSAQEAFDRGLVNAVVPHEEFAETAEKTVQQFSSRPPESLRVSKKLIRSIQRQQLTEVNTDECNSILGRWQSNECRQAIANFLSREKQ